MSGSESLMRAQDRLLVKVQPGGPGHSIVERSGLWDDHQRDTSSCGMEPA